MNEINNDTNRVRVLVTAKVLKQILADHPEVEIELVKGASAQVAADFKKKVDIKTIANGVIAEINDKLRYRPHFPKEVLEEIKNAADRALGEKAIDQAQKAALDAMAKNLNFWWAQNQKALESRIETLVSNKIEILLKTMARFK